MITYTSGRNLYGVISGNKTTSNLNDGTTLANDYTRSILAERPWPFLMKTRGDSATTGVQFYNLPPDFSRLENVYVVSGSTRYNPETVPSHEFWNVLNETTVSSDIPEWYFVFNGQVGIYPVPASGSPSIYQVYSAQHKDLTRPDYTTGFIQTATNASAVVVGTGTTWTSAMAGRWIYFTTDDTTASGDGNWYKISSVESATSMTLTSSYLGVTVSAGTSYIVGQVSLIPPDYQSIPWRLAAADYLDDVNPQKASTERAVALNDLKNMRNAFSSTTNNPAVSEDNPGFINPNLTVTTL